MSNQGLRRIILSWVLCLIVALFVAGCGQDEATTVTVAGSMELAGPQALPEHANARISVFEHRDGGGDKRIVAERTLHDLDDKSIKFTVDIERNLIDPAGDYGLRGEVLAEDGTILWQSKNAKKIRPLEIDSEVRLELVPNATDADLTFEQFRCEDGFHLAAAIQDKRTVVRLGNRRLVMPSAKQAGSFKGEHGNALTKDGDMVEVNIDDSAHKNCAVVASQSPPAAGETAVAPPAEQAGDETTGHDEDTKAGDKQSEPAESD